MKIRNTSPARRLAAALLLSLAAIGASAQPVPLGPDVSVTPFGHCPGLAGHADGTFAVAWNGGLQGGTTTMSVRGGTLAGGLGPTSVAAVEAPGLTGRTEMAATAAGYTATWQVVREDNSRPHFALTTDRTGIPLGRPQILNRQSLGISPRPVGGFVAHWQSEREDTVFLQLIDAGGRETTRRLSQPARYAVWTGVAHRPNGELVVYWYERRRLTNPNRGGGVNGRRFDALGRPLGKVFQLAPPGDGSLSQDLFRLAIGPDGTMAAVWAFRPPDGETGREGLHTRMFDRTGKPLGRIHELMGAPARDGLWFVPAGPAVDAQRRALVTGSRVEGDLIRARALALVAGSRNGPAFDVSEHPEARSTFCPEAAVVGNAWLVAWYATSSGETFVRAFTR